MANSNSVMIHKLQNAINQKYNIKLLYNKTQWYSEKQSRPVTVYLIRQAVLDEKTGKHKNIELFSSHSMIQVVLFLRDLWYELNDWEVPTDNQEWNRAKALYYSKQQPNDIQPTVKENKNG